MTRPITILASVYRLWAKLVTKKMLAHIQAHLPKTLYGSVPGRCKMDMIGVVQTKIEKALLQGQDLCGISLDYSKAYNTLPRDILAKINQRLGMGEFWSPYHNFLGKLQRHFTSAGSWGEAIYSSVGVPEGCPIAVVQMILITWLCTVYVRSESQAEIHSYVDDWVALLQQSDQALKAVQAIRCISGKLGMILSLKKSTICNQSQADQHHSGTTGTTWLGARYNSQPHWAWYQFSDNGATQPRDERQAMGICKDPFGTPTIYALDDTPENTDTDEGNLPLDFLWMPYVENWKRIP